MSSQILTHGLRRLTSCSLGEGLDSKVPARAEKTDVVRVEAVEEATDEVSAVRRGGVAEEAASGEKGWGLA
jgi:hypothetical protein